MAVVLAFRIAIVLTPIAYRWVAAGGATYSGAIEHGLLQYWERLHDPDEDPSELAAEMSAGYPEDGAAFSVTDFTGTFELRKLQWRLSRAPAGGTIEDQDVCTFHFINATGGTPGDPTASDLAAVETALGAYWNSLKGSYPSFTHSDQYRWYKDGPAFYTLNSDGTHYVPIGDNPAIRITEVDVAGADSSTLMLPPQVAVTVTERTSSTRHWGRWYLPAPVSACADTAGRIDAAVRTAWLGYAVTFYNACRAAHMVPVVWSIQKPERPKAGGGTLPAYSAQAFEVNALQMDNLFDVIRRRRYDKATGKTATTLT